jgi:hypothetical protein
LNGYVRIEYRDEVFLVNFLGGYEVVLVVKEGCKDKKKVG